MIIESLKKYQQTSDLLQNQLSNQQDKIENYLVKTYGVKQAQQLKNESKTRNDLVKKIIIRDLQRTYKQAEAAYNAIDFNGKGYIEIEDFMNAKFIYRLPFTQEELREFLQNYTIFRRKKQLKIEMFKRFFFQQKQDQANESDSESDDNQGLKTQQSFDQIDNQSNSSLSKNVQMTQKIKEIEQELKERFQNNWVSVRKAFLDLDLDYDGYLGAEEFSKLLGGSTGNQKYDYNLIKLLVKLRSNDQIGKINYTDFCQWFGQVIDPIEGFYFRHDSMKNPQYEKNLKKTVQKYSDQQYKIRELITAQNLKQLFLSKIYSQYNSIQKAFTEMNKNRNGYILYDDFEQVIKDWGFVASKQQIIDLFHWLDQDNDNRISFLDLRQSAGKETNPTEGLFFRQDKKPPKQIICQYDRCWENNNFNSKSQYCPLHQKIIRNICLDRFSQLVIKITEMRWNEMLQEIQIKNYQMTLGDFSQFLQKYTNYSLKQKEKEYLFESFRVIENLEENAENLDERLISLQAFVNSRKNVGQRKMNELINFEKENEQAQEEYKLKGLVSVDKEFIINMANQNKTNWGGIWRAIKQIDKDMNGFVTIDELENIFKEYFPVELENKTVYNILKQYRSVNNKVLVNYKQIKDEINSTLIQRFNQNKLQSMYSKFQNNVKPSYLNNGQEDQKISDKRKSIQMESNLTPIKQNEQIQLPQQNIVKRNQSIQKLNDFSTIDNQETQKQKNLRSITPIMSKESLKSYKIQQSKNKIIEDIKQKLIYEWKNIYRSVILADQDRTGVININAFNKIIHQQKVYLSREELRKIESYFGTQESGSLGQEIDYIKISQELGLHKPSLNYIQSKSKQFVDQLSKMKDNESMRSLSTLDQIKNQYQYPKTHRDQDDQIRIKAKQVYEIIQKQDKQNIGLTSTQNFNQLIKKIGLYLNEKQIKVTSDGHIDYKETLQGLMI